MAAHPPRPRRWFVRRRRFLDAQGGQVTDTWLNFPLLPRRMLTRRGPDWGVWQVQFSPSPLGCGVLPAVLLVVALVLDIFRDVGTGQWVASIPNYLIMLGAISILTVMTWRAIHRRA